MKGLTRLEVDILRDAAAPEMVEPKVAWSPEMNDACIRLLHRGLIRLVVLQKKSSFEVDTICGAITPLGRLALSIALVEPSLVSP